MVRDNGKKRLIVLGVYNAHLGLLEDRRDDENEEMVMECLEKFDLVLMNADEKFKGFFTSRRRKQNTEIDFMQVIQYVYDICMSMNIDEKDIMGLSDHCLVMLGHKLREGSCRMGEGGM